MTDCAALSAEGFQCWLVSTTARHHAGRWVASIPEDGLGWADLGGTAGATHQTRHGPGAQPADLHLLLWDGTSSVCHNQVVVRWSGSARTHRIGRAHAEHVMANSFGERTITARGGTALLFIGLDDRGVELEILVVVDGEDVIVIHVMPTQHRK